MECAPGPGRPGPDVVSPGPAATNESIRLMSNSDARVGPTRAIMRRRAHVAGSVVEVLAAVARTKPAVAGVAGVVLADDVCRQQNPLFRHISCFFFRRGHFFATCFEPSASDRSFFRSCQCNCTSPTPHCPHPHPQKFAATPLPKPNCPSIPSFPPGLL